MTKLLVLAIALLSCTPASAVTLGGDVVLMDGPIRGDVADKWTAELMRAKTSVDIVINSPGGSVYAGFRVINAITLLREREVTVRCFVTNLAASMAFQILAHCDERYALKFSALLWHPVRVGLMFATLTPDAARQLADDLARVETTLKDDLREERSISEDLFMYHYLAETLHTGNELEVLVPGFIKVVKDIGGLRAMSGFGKATAEEDYNIPEGELWYIRPSKK